jgi:hypothetical protein
MLNVLNVSLVSYETPIYFFLFVHEQENKSDFLVVSVVVFVFKGKEQVD